MVLAAALTLASSPAGSQTIDSEFVGPGASWIDPANWSPLLGVYPRNDSGLSIDFRVLLPDATCPGAGVNFDDLSGPAEITSLTLEYGCELNLLAGTDLTVQLDAMLNGRIDGTGGNLTATADAGTQTVFADGIGTPDRASIFASNGSVLTLDPLVYSAKGLTGNNGSGGANGLINWTILSASGASTLVDLSTATSIDEGFAQNSNDRNRHFVSAAAGGTIDFSSVTSVESPVYIDDLLELRVNGLDSSILLPSLAVIENSVPLTRPGFGTGGTGSLGQTRLAAENGGRLCLPSATLLENVVFSAASGGVVAVSGGDVAYCGGVISDDGLPAATYSVHELVRDNFNGGANGFATWTLIEATGTDSIVDLSAVTEFDGAFDQWSNDINRHFISAATGGTIDLSGLTSIEPPIYIDDLLELRVNGADSAILLPSLAVIENSVPLTRPGFGTGGTGSLGQMRLAAENGGQLCLPSATLLENVVFSASSGGAVAVSGGDVAYCGGDIPDDGVPAATYSVRELVRDNFDGGANGLGTWILIEATGTDSIVDLSAVTAFDGAFDRWSNDINRHRVRALSGGVIDLSGVQSLAPPGHYLDWIELEVDGAASEIILTSLESVSNPAGVGRNRLYVRGGATECLPSLRRLENSEVEVSGAASLVVDGTDDDCGGGLAAGVIPSGVYSATELTANNGSGGSGGLTNWTILQANGAGSLMNLAAFREFDDGFPQDSNDFNRHFVTASSGSQIDLSGIEHLILPRLTTGVWLTFTVSGGSQLNLQSLEKTTGGRAIFDVTDSSLTVGNLLAATRFSVAATDSGAGSPPSLTFSGSLQVMGSSTLLPSTAPASLEGDLVFDVQSVSALDLSETTLTMAGSGTQILEIAGFDSTSTCPLLPDSNFGIGQLVVGDGSGSSVVMLMDQIDNGRSGGIGGADEALYLFGPGSGAICGRSGGDGLVISSGSTLFLNDEDLYAYDDSAGALLHVNSLFPGPGDPNCVTAFGGTICLSAPVLSDADGDLVADADDNCLNLPNGPYQSSPQLDADDDGYGDVCDADYDQSAAVNALDFARFLGDFVRGTGWNTDHNADGNVDGLDFANFLGQFTTASVGSSGLACADPTIDVLGGDPGCAP